MSFSKGLFRFQVALATATALSPCLAQVPTVPAGAEFLVNTYTNSEQSSASVAGDPAGAFVVVWQSSGSADTDTSNFSIQGQRYASGGSREGGEFQVNTFTSSNQRAPSVAMDPEGDFVVVWESYGADSSDDGIQGQRYASDGSRVGGEFQVNTYTTSAQTEPSVAVDSEGAFVIVWESYGSMGTDSSYRSIQGQRFASDGSQVGDQFQVNTYTTTLQIAPSVAVDPEGDFVVVWQSPISGWDIQGQRFASDGTRVSSEFKVNTATPGSQTSPSVAVDSRGDFVVGWFSQPSQIVVGQRFASDGSQVGGEFLEMSSAAAAPSVAVDSDGDFVIAWSSGETDIRAQRFASDGQQLGIDFQVNTYTTLHQVDPVVVVDPEGDFVVVWESYGSAGTDSSYESVQGQRYRVTADVGDVVWLDEDFDGLQGGAEPGVQGVTVHLYDSSDGSLMSTTESDSEGAFGFRPKIGLAGVVDEFHLAFEAPRRYSFTSPDVGSDDTTDSDADTVLGTTENFEIPSAGDERLDMDAGLANGIGDRVWFDADGNGLQDGGESGAPSVGVELFGGDGVSQGTTTTDAAGRYSFADLDAGTYYLQFTPPGGFLFTARDAGGDDELDSDAHPLTGTTATFSFPIGAVQARWDAGLVPEPSTEVRIGDRVWMDSDGNGIQDGGEPGVQGVTVTLRKTAAPPRGTDPSTSTDADGYYTLSADPGFYFLEFTLPAGQAFVPRDQGSDDGVDSDVNPGSGTTIAFEAAPGSVTGAWDAGLEPATIGDRVWLDTSGDGRQQPGERGLADVTVRLLDAEGAAIAATITDAQGVYGFLGIPTGVYRVEVVLPAEGTFSPQGVGSDDRLDSDVDPGDGRTEPFSYVAGTASRSHDAGILFPPFFEDGFESGTTSGWSG